MAKVIALGAVNRLDDDETTQPSATRAQPEAYVEDLDASDVDVSLGKVVSRDGIEPSTRRLRAAHTT
jgi:hypothetical protein